MKAKSIKTVKVFFDTTNLIIGKGNGGVEKILNPILSTDIKNIVDFSVEHTLDNRLMVAVTETNYKEGLRALQETLQAKVRKIINISDDLVKLSPDFFQKYILSDSDLNTEIEKKFNEKLQEYKIQVISTDKDLKVIDLLDSAVNYDFAFETDDKGFRDSLSWLSIIKDASSIEDCLYIYITGDGVFSVKKETLEKDFSTKTGNQIIIEKDASKIQDIVDEKLKLGIGLTRIKSEILEFLKKDTSFFEEISDEVIKKHNRKKSQYELFLQPYNTRNLNNHSERKVLSLNFAGNIHILNVDKKPDGQVVANIEVIYMAEYEPGSAIDIFAESNTIRQQIEVTYKNKEILKYILGESFSYITFWE